MTHLKQLGEPIRPGELAASMPVPPEPAEQPKRPETKVTLTGLAKELITAVESVKEQTNRRNMIAELIAHNSVMSADPVLFLTMPADGTQHALNLRHVPQELVETILLALIDQAEYSTIDAWGTIKTLCESADTLVKSLQAESTNGTEMA